MYSSFLRFIIILFLFSLFFNIIFSTSFLSHTSFSNNTEILTSDSNYFFWPLPDNYNITSYFGKRRAPTKGSSTYHSGIDIAARAGTKLYSCISGTVTFLGFKGAGGYTLTVKSDNITVSFCHISSSFRVSINDYVTKGMYIANVGPKNVYGVPNNPYKDSNGVPTNGATTGSHLHLTIKKDGYAVNPLSFFDY